MRDFDLSTITHLGVRDLLRWARSIGVEVKDLDDVEVPFDPEGDLGLSYNDSSQSFMKRHFRASRCPNDSDGFYVYVAFGRPAQGRRGVVYLGAYAEDAEEWDAGSYPPEVVLLHEIAHAVAGPECNTCTWETAAARVLYGESNESASIWQELKAYQLGADCSEPYREPRRERRVARRLEAYGILPVQIPGSGVQMSLPLQGSLPQARE